MQPIIKEEIEEAYALKEASLLWHHMASPNPLVRAYSHRMYDALKAEELHAA